MELIHNRKYGMKNETNSIFLFAYNWLNIYPLNL